MPDAGDPLLDLLGYRDITKDGVTLPRRSLINFVGGAVTDNPTLGATDVNISGVADDYKDSVRAATTGVLPGQTRAVNVMTADANGAFPAQDTVSLAVGEDLLVKSQPAGEDEGIWVVTDLGSGSTPWALTRRDDFNSDAEVTSMAIVPVSEGAVNGGKNFQLKTPDPIIINITELLFEEFGGGAGSLNDALATGNTTSGLNIVVSNGDSITGADAATGGDLPLTAGTGSGGAGGTLTVSSGSGSTVAGDLKLNIPGAPTAAPNFEFQYSSLLYASIGLAATPAPAGSTQGFYLGDIGADFTFGYQPVVGSSGKDLFFVAQDSDSTGGDITVVAGSSAAGTGGSASLNAASGTISGGSTTVEAGAATAGNGSGGTLTVQAGDSFGDGAPGIVQVSAGEAAVNSAGGSVQIDSGAGGSASGPGGFLSVQAGQGIATGAAGGQLRLRGGVSDNGSSGGVLIATEDGAATNGDDVGLIEITGGNAGASTDSDGGSINISAGLLDGSGANGTVGFLSGATAYALSPTTGPALATTAQTIIGAINENADNVTGSLTTVNDTPAAIATFVTTTDNTTVKMGLSIIARDVTSGDRATWDVIATASRDGSSVVLVIDEDFTHVFKQDASWDVTFTITSQTINILVTGDDTNNVNFELTGRAIEKA